MVREIEFDPDWWNTGVVDGRSMRGVLADRNIALLFQFLHSRGISWSSVAVVTGLSDTRVREIATGRRQVSSYEVLERIATGLHIPRHFMGLGLDRGASEPPGRSTRSLVRAAVTPDSDAGLKFRDDKLRPETKEPSHSDSANGGVKQRQEGITIGRQPTDESEHSTREPDIHVALPWAVPGLQRYGSLELDGGPSPGASSLSQALGISVEEARSLGALAGNVIELELAVSIDIERDGQALVTYTHKLLNIANRPVPKFSREVWFKHTCGPIVITPTDNDATNIVIQRVHDTPTLAKFACQLSPPIPPGEIATAAYTVRGGRFIDEFYWRQATPRYAHRLSMDVRHRGGRRLYSCVAVAENPDGSEHSASDELKWDYEGSDIVVSLAVNRLRPNQAVTLRWEASLESS